MTFCRMSAVALLFYYCAVLYSGQQKHVKTQVNKISAIAQISSNSNGTSFPVSSSTSLTGRPIGIIFTAHLCNMSWRQNTWNFSIRYVKYVNGQVCKFGLLYTVCPEKKRDRNVFRNIFYKTQAILMKFGRPTPFPE